MNSSSHREPTRREIDTMALRARELIAGGVRNTEAVRRALGEWEHEEHKKSRGIVPSMKVTLGDLIQAKQRTSKQDKGRS